jgi:Zn-dependent protease
VEHTIEGKEQLKFKVEVCLLVLAITFFSVAMFCYGYQTAGDGAALSFAASYPYRGIALAFVGVGSASMLTASVSYQKKTKNMLS